MAINFRYRRSNKWYVMKPDFFSIHSLLNGGNQMAFFFHEISMKYRQLQSQWDSPFSL